MTTKIIITPASQGSKAAAQLGAPRTVRVVTVGGPPSAGRGPQTKVMKVPLPQSTANRGPIRTVIKRVYSSSSGMGSGITPTTTTTTASSSPAVLPILATPPRKRQKLDHLTADQKNQRRKMKNRVAAQTARDRKKLQMDLLESRVENLERQNDKLVQQNTFLQKQNELLSQQNALLMQRLDPAAGAAPSPASVESAALISGPRQQGQEERGAAPQTAAAALLALSLISWAGIQVTLAATAALSTCSRFSARPSSVKSWRREGRWSPPMIWWGPQQKSWSPAMIR